MITWEEIDGSWNKIKGSIQQRWGELTEDDLAQVRGNASQLIGAIQQKTGETREVIERYLEDVAAQGKSYAAKTAGMAKEYGQHVADAARHSYERVAEGVSSGAEHAEQSLRRRPFASVGAVFAAGIVLGVVAGLVIRKR